MKNCLGLIVFFVILFIPVNVDAHMVGQPPFFKINGEYSDLYPVPTSSITNFNLPQDIAKQNHLVGENLNMEMDVNQLPILPEVIDNTRFDWDFGDGSKASGLKNNHAYSKPGSYVLTIMAAYRTDEPQLIQSTLINILPDKNYQMPEAKIVANNQSSKDPLIDIIKADFKEPVQFKSSDSTAKDGVKEYLWDFGDGQTSNDPNPTHTYDQEAFQVFPVLRVKDQNGFIHDTYIQLENSNDASNKASFLSSTSNNFWTFIGIGVVVVVVVTGLLIVRKQIKK